MIWGLIGGGVGLIGLLVGLFFFLSSEKEQVPPETPAEVAGDGSAESPENSTSETPQLFPQFAANQQTKADSNVPRKPAPILAPGPDGVIPAPAAAGQAAGANGRNLIKYSLKPKQQFAYRTTIKAKVGNESYDVSGMCTYEVLEHDPFVDRLMPKPNADEQHASGTGFVVHPDGYLMTCAHVIEGARSIEVSLGENRYAARVVEVNSQRDLALIQIAARDLPVLPLGDSKQIELAQHVRVVGYPLSDVLGTSVKVTQGSVAGFIEQKKGRMIQVDASMNPGNSGGPLVNDRGDAIGVASAGFFGSDISEIGLAVPADDVAALLKKNGVSPQQANSSGESLNGPDLARKVTPSVGFLKVTLGSAPAKTVILKQFSSFHTMKRASDGRIITGSTNSRSDSGKLVIDEFGNVVYASDPDATLPFSLGPLSQLVIEPFSDRGETTWGKQRLTKITQVKKTTSTYDPYSRYPSLRYPSSRYRSPYSRPRPLPMPRSPYDRGTTSEVTKVYLAIQAAEYELKEASGQTQTIRKDYLLRTIDDATTPYLQMAGTGTIRFDRAKSLPEDLHYEIVYQVRLDNGTLLRVPIDLVCKKFSDEELADYNQKLAAKVEEYAKKREELAKSNPTPTRPAKPTLEENIAVITDPNKNTSQKMSAMFNIKRMAVVEEQRKNVLDAVEPYLDGKESTLVTYACYVFSVWGTEERAAKLIELTEDFSQSHRRHAIDTLGDIGGKKAAEAVAKRLTNETDLYSASTALKKMGSVAEAPVLKLIDHDEQKIRYQVYYILRDVGGTKSLAALKDKAESDPVSVNRSVAGSAARDIERRLGS